MAGAGDDDDARLHLIVLDGSASMGHGDRWERARDAANDVLGDLGTEDRAQIVLAGRLFEVLGPPTGDVAALRQMCLSWGVVPLGIVASKDIMQTLAQVKEWGVTAGRLNSGDRIVLVAGTGLPSASHNLAMVHEVK